MKLLSAAADLSFDHEHRLFPQNLPSISEECVNRYVLVLVAAVVLLIRWMNAGIDGGMASRMLFFLFLIRSLSSGFVLCQPVVAQLIFGWMANLDRGTSTAALWNIQLSFRTLFSCIPPSSNSILHDCYQMNISLLALNETTKQCLTMTSSRLGFYLCLPFLQLKSYCSDMLLFVAIKYFAVSSLCCLPLASCL